MVAALVPKDNSPNCCSSVIRRLALSTKMKTALTQLTYELLSAEDENKMLRQILSSSTDPILITSRDVTIFYVNPAWEKLTGYSFNEVKGKSPNILKSGKTPRSIYRKMWQALSQNQSFTTEEVIDKRKDGSLYQIHSSIFPVLKENNVAYYVQIHHDITKRKHIDEMKAQFLSVISHELKTPITVLKLFTQARIARAQKTGSVFLTSEELKGFDRELTRLTNLINDMLDSSRIETGRMHLNIEYVNLNELIESTLENARELSKEHRIVFKDFQECMIFVDRERLKQVFLNLLTNAIKYSPQGTEIVIRTKKNKKNITVTVEDFGIGIHKNERKAIFDKFYQVEKHATTGFGLGLYISSEIIKQHRGKMWVKSAVGKGSTFFFTLPLQVSN